MLMNPFKITDIKIRNKYIADIQNVPGGFEPVRKKILVYWSMKDQYLNHHAIENSP